jgi:4-amino-4-deoxy-L-arabinose transferase-like glycosyltransferase
VTVAAGVPTASSGAAGVEPTVRGWRRRLEVAATERFGRATLLVAFGGLALRLVLGRFEPPPPFRAVVADEIWYVRVAHNLLDGHGFVNVFYPFVKAPTAFHGPLTVLLLLPSTALEPNGYTLQRATMGLLGAVSVVTLAYVGRELAGPRVGVVAAVVAALYPGLWVNDLVATSETPAILLLSAVLLLVLRYRREPTTRRLVLLGLSLGLLALDRAELSLLGLLLVVPAIVAVSRRSAAPLATAVRALLVVGVLAILVVTPWSAYNQARFHQTVLISTDLGQTLVGANCPQSYYGPLTGYNGKTCFIPVLGAELHRYPHGSNEAVQDGFYRDHALSYAVHHWHRWPIVAVMRELWLWSLWKPGWTVSIAGYFIGRPRWIAWTQILSFWLLTPFALYGFLLARRRKIPVAQLVTLVAFTATIGLLVVGNLRYRISAEIAWVLFGAIAIDRLVFGARDAHEAPVASSVGGGGSDLG